MKNSIVMATYNGVKYLQEQLDSFASQTILPDELVVVDDCSTDNTIAILNNFKDKAPFKTIIIKNDKNLGSTKSFEKAATKATGDLIFFSDQDDFWKPNKIELFQKAMEQDSNIGLVYSDYEIVDENLQPIISTKKLPDYQNPIIESSNACEFFLNNSAISGCTMAIKKNIIETALPFNTQYHDNWLVWVTSVFHKIKYIDEKLLYYRQHLGQQVGLGLIKKSHKSHKTLKFNNYNKKAIDRARTIKQELTFIQEASNYLQKYSTSESSLKSLVDRALSFYKMRYASCKKNIFLRLPMIIPFLLNGSYKFWFGKEAFKMLRKDVYYPAVSNTEI